MMYWRTDAQITPSLTTVCFLINHIKQIDYMLPWVCTRSHHRWCQNAVWTSVSHLAASCVLFSILTTILTSSVIDYWAVAWLCGIYLLNGTWLSYWICIFFSFNSSLHRNWNWTKKAILHMKRFHCNDFHLYIIKL